MGKRSKSGGKTKKKSSGKKARAKAKLERQWGEEYVTNDKQDEDDRTLTTKRPRIRTAATLPAQPPGVRGVTKGSDRDVLVSRKATRDELSSDSSDESVDSQGLDGDHDDEENQQEAVQSFLQSLQNRKRRRPIEDDSSVEDSDKDDSQSESESEESAQRDQLHEAADYSMDKPPAPSSRVVTGPFFRRFGRQKESSVGDYSDLLQELHSQTTTIPITPSPLASKATKSLVSVQVSTKLLQDMAIVPSGETTAATDVNNVGRLLQQQTKALMKSNFGPAHRDSSPAIDWKSWMIDYRNNHKLIKLSNLQWNLFGQCYSLIANYADALLVSSTLSPSIMSGQSVKELASQALNLAQERQLTMFLIQDHMLRHVLTHQQRIYRHNAKLRYLENKQARIDAKSNDDHSNAGDSASETKENESINADDSEDKSEEENNGDGDDNDDEDDDWKRDQGYTRPTVLVLLPTRGSCYDFVTSLMEVAQIPVKHIPSDYWERFEAEFGPPETDSEEEKDLSKADILRRRKKVLAQKGQEWLGLFGDDVNDDDDFKLGLSFQYHAKKKGKRQENTHSVKFFTDFYKSDFIIASPLGLKMAVSAKQGGDENEDEDEEDAESRRESAVDFLSSIEICLISRADVMLMQNWDHVQDVLKLLNQQPKSTKFTDFSRVRPYFLEGHAAHWRQLIISSEYLDPMIQSTFKRHAKSSHGVVRLRRKIATDESGISNVFVPTRQVFYRVPSPSFSQHGASRVKYFADKVLPQILEHKQKHTMIFIPSYYDFVAVRNILLKKECDFVSVTEYARGSEVTRGRARFLQGRKPIMLYTGRAHFFHRHIIKGVRHLVFLGLPEYANFYSDLVFLLNEGSNEAVSSSSCLSLFTKYDAHALERIVGSSNCNAMLTGSKATFVFS